MGSVAQVGKEVEVMSEQDQRDEALAAARRALTELHNFRFAVNLGHDCPKNAAAGHLLCEALQRIEALEIEG